MASDAMAAVRDASARSEARTRLGTSIPIDRAMSGRMSDSGAMPAPARHLAGFPPFLRGFGFTTSPEQTVAFLEAVGLLGPRGIDDVRRAAIATLSPPRERTGEFDALFRAWFHGEVAPIPHESEDETEVRVHDEGSARHVSPEAPDLGESGQSATPVEMLGDRRFRADTSIERLRRFAREAPERLPQRRGLRRTRARRGDTVDLRRVLRAAIRHGGDTPVLTWRRRRLRQRRILLLVDISGSMKEHTESALRFAHALHRASERMECFTLGTRLTRITGAIRLRNPEAALAKASALVPDWDGGTRIGDALAAFLAVPRFSGSARGAVVVVLSDGLERGGPDTMAGAVARLSRLAWRVSWLTPLAADPAFRPDTTALAAVAPYLDDLGDGASPDALCRHMLSLGRARNRAGGAPHRSQHGPGRSLLPGGARDGIRRSMRR